MKKSLIIAIAAFSISAIAGSAKAVVLEWTFQNALFGDGTAIVGSFGYDATTNTYSDIDITTSAGSGFPGTGYNFIDFGGASGFQITAFPIGFSLSTDSPMTNAGGTIGIFAFEVLDVIVFDTFREAGGTITAAAPAVPLPAALPLLASAIGLMGFFGHRRRKAM